MAKKKKAGPVAPEWSHLIDVEHISDGPLAVTIAPDEEAKKKIAQRLGLDSLDDLSADIEFFRDTGSLVVHVSGNFQAKMTQACVVTGAPVVSTVSEDFEAWFADPDEAVPFAKARQQRMAKKTHAELPILEESEDPEPIVGGKIDAGELVVQFLSLAVDPYPHAEGVAHEHDGDGDEAQKPARSEGVFRNPFAALKDWKNRPE